MTDEAKAILTLIRSNQFSSEEWLCGGIDSILDECQQEAMAQERMTCEETHDTEAARFRAELDEAREHSDEQHEGLRQAIAEMDALRRRVAALEGALGRIQWIAGSTAGHKEALSDCLRIADEALAAPAPEALRHPIKEHEWTQEEQDEFDAGARSVVEIAAEARELVVEVGAMSYAGECNDCGKAVYHRPEKPGEFDHVCRGGR